MLRAVSSTSRPMMKARPSGKTCAQFGSGVMLKPMAGEPKLLRRRCELGDEIAARVNVGEEARRGKFLGDRHAAIGLVALEHQDLQPGAGEIAGASEPVMSGADDNGLVGAGHFS